MIGVLFSALAPTISHAMAASSDSVDTVQICTMNGMKLVSVTDSPAGKTILDDHVFKHCPYCVMHSGGAALPTKPVIFAFVAPAASYPPLFYQSAVPLLSWTAAAPRGPPRLS